MNTMMEKNKMKISEKTAFKTDDKDPPKNGKDYVVAARDFSVYYGNFHAVKNANVSFERGKVTAIIGPSGCGKSTFLRCVNRMNDLVDSCRTSGELIFDGINIYHPRLDIVELRRRIGMVFQRPNPFPNSIYDNIAYGPRLAGSIKKSELDGIVETSLRRAALWDEVKDRLNSNALGLSGGQQQRLCIARALAVRPEVLLMDEPCSALDPKSTSRIEDLIDELSGEYTIAIVTHNMQQAARVSHYTAFFYEGSLIEFGKTETLFTSPQKQATNDYITGRFG